MDNRAESRSGARRSRNGACVFALALAAWGWSAAAAGQQAPDFPECVRSRQQFALGNTAQGNQWAQRCARHRAAQAVAPDAARPAYGAPTAAAVTQRATAPWEAELPPAERVMQAIQGANPADRAARQTTALQVLSEYIQFMTGRPPLDLASNITVPGHAEFVDYLKARNDLSARRSGLAGAVQDWPLDRARHEVLAAFLPQASQDNYWRTVNAQAQQAAAEKTQANAQATARANAQPWVDRDKELARNAHVDMSIFGIPLGEPLNLPRCGGMNTDSLIIGGLTGVARGAPETCVGESMGQTAIVLTALAEKLTGSKSAPDGMDPVSVGLADSKCPMWLKTSGTCTVAARAAGGTLVSVSVSSGVDPDALLRVPEELVRKYGPADPGGRPVQCTNDVTRRVVASNGTWADVPVGNQTHNGTALSWSRIPGLYVSYVPFAIPGNCRSGLIRVELAGYHRATIDVAARTEAAGPKM